MSRPKIFDLIKKVTKLEEKNAITIGLSENTTLTSTTAYQRIKIPLNQVRATLGNKLSLENNAIKIGTGVSKVLISGKLTMGGVNDSSGFYVEKNNGERVGGVFQAATGSLFSMTIDSFLCDVEEGDTIYETVYINASGSSRAIRGDYETTLTVQVVD